MTKNSYSTGLGVAIAAAFLDPIWTLLSSGKAWAPHALWLALGTTSLLALGLFSLLVAVARGLAARVAAERFDAGLFSGGCLFGTSLGWTWLYPSPGAPSDHLFLAALGSIALGLFVGVGLERAWPTEGGMGGILRILPGLAAVTLGFVWFQKYEVGSLFSAASLLSVVMVSVVILAFILISMKAPRASRWVPAATVGLVVLSTAASIGVRAGASDPPAEGTGTGNAPSVLLLTIDTLRADRFDCAGGRGLTLLCRRGTEFEGLSPAPWTLPALASLHTGVSPLIHGALGKASRLDAGFVTLAEILEREGYRTHAISHSAIVRPSRGLLQGFQTYDLFPSKTPSSYTAKLAGRIARHLPVRARLDSTPTSIASLAYDWIEDNRDRPYFLWVHQYDPHAPYHPPQDYRIPRDRDRFGGRFNQLRDIVEGTLIPSPAEKLEIQALYDAEVEYVREELNRLLERLDDEGWFDELLVILTSDHGEEFFEHGRAGHGHTLYDELLRVPLVVKFPGGTDSSVQGSASTTQVVATVLDSLRLTPPHDRLDPPLSGASPTRHIAGGMLYFEPQIAVRTTEFKYIWMPESGREEVYDLTAEPEERSNLGGVRPELIESARSILDEFLAESMQARSELGLNDDSPTSVDPDAEDQLRALGYIQ